MQTKCAGDDGNTAIFPIEPAVSLAGAEFGMEKAGFSNKNPGRFGKEYTYPTSATIRFFVSRGFRTLRIPVCWERLQPTLDGPLDSLEVKRLDRTLEAIRHAGGRAIIDLHNYGRYTLLVDGRPMTLRIDQRTTKGVLVSKENLANLWQRVATRYADTGVLGYGLMNEPHDMYPSDWKAISQHSVDAIRSFDDETWILVAGDNWSSAREFSTSNGPVAWVRDPSNRIVYEAHCYMDFDGSGQYRLPYSIELQRDEELTSRPKKWLSPFIKWCQQNDVQGFLGEFGIPVQKDKRWRSMLSDSQTELQKANIPICLWAAGEWWGDYPLSIQPTRLRTPPTRSNKVDENVAEILELTVPLGAK